MTIWTEFLGAQIHYANVGSWQTRYVVGGDGSPIVLLHGTGGHLENHSKIFELLKENYTVYALDLVGHGLTEKPNTEYTIPLWGNHVEQFIEKIVGEPATIVGQSLGGWIASWVGKYSPSNVRNLVLITSVGFELLGDERKQVEEFLNFQQEISLESIRERYTLLVNDENAIPDEWVELRYLLYSRPDTKQVMEHWNDYLSDLLEPDDSVEEYILNTTTLREIEPDIQLIWSDGESFTPLSAVKRALPAEPTIQLTVIKGAGHFVHLEKPSETVKIINAHLNQS